MFHHFILAAVLVLGILSSSAESRAEDLLSEEQIRHVVSENADQVLTCYREHAMRQKDATGHVALRMVVEKAGSVREPSIEVEAEGVRGPSFARCVQNKVRHWTFPASRAPTSVEYPFYFQHTHAPGAGPR